MIIETNEDDDANNF